MLGKLPSINKELDVKEFDVTASVSDAAGCWPNDQPNIVNPDEHPEPPKLNCEFAMVTSSAPVAIDIDANEITSDEPANVTPFTVMLAQPAPRVLAVFVSVVLVMTQAASVDARSRRGSRSNTTVGV